METKIQKFQNALPAIFGTHDVSFIGIRCEEPTYCVRSYKTGMFRGVELVKLIALSNKLGLNFFVRSNSLENRVDCVEFVIYE